MGFLDWMPMNTINVSPALLLISKLRTLYHAEEVVAEFRCGFLAARDFGFQKLGQPTCLDSANEIPGIVRSLVDMCRISHIWVATWRCLLEAKYRVSYNRKKDEPAPGSKSWMETVVLAENPTQSLPAQRGSDPAARFQ